MTVTRQIVPAKLQKRYRGTNKKRFITVHETANLSKGAGAKAHANLQSRGNPGRDASWHYQVDDKFTVQSYEDDSQCWHTGKGGDTGNLDSISIEICVNSDSNFEQALDRAAVLVRALMAKYKIPLANVVQHNRWSGKNCPSRLRANNNTGWKTFLVRVGTTTDTEWDDMATEADLRRVVREELTNLLETHIGGNPATGSPSSVRESLAIARNYSWRASTTGNQTLARVVALESVVSQLAIGEGVDPVVIQKAVQDAIKEIEVKVELS